MIIGIDASRLVQTHKTGVEWYTLYLLQALKTVIPEDVQVFLYTPASIKNQIGDLPKNWQEKILTWPPKRLWTQFRLSYEMFQNSPDVLFVPSHVMPIIHPKQTVMTIHDIAAWRFPQAFNLFQRWYTLWAARYAMNQLPAIIVPSKATESELIAYTKKNTDKIAVIPHGIGEDFFETVSQENRKKIRDTFDMDGKYFIAIGRIETKKNTARIIESYEAYRKKNPSDRTKLVVVGTDGHGADNVHILAKKSLYASDIIFFGWVAEEDMLYLLADAVCLVFPSLYEGFGLPVLESLALGVPVIASTGSALENFVYDGVIHVDPYDTAQLAQTLYTMKFSPPSIISQEKLRQLYSWKNTAQKTAQTLISLF